MKKSKSSSLLGDQELKELLHFVQNCSQALLWVNLKDYNIINISEGFEMF